MIINNVNSEYSKKFIFIHIPKTGGHSMRGVLKKRHTNSERLCQQRGIHPNINDYIKEGYNLDNFFKFAFVRNPWDRLLSNYHFRIQIMRSKDTAAVSFRDWVLNSKTKRGHSFLNTGEMYKPQCSYITFNKTKMVDFIGRYENLQQDWDFVCDQLQIKKQTLPHKNKSSHSSYRDYYDEDTIDLVSEYFQEDIENFDYEF